MNPYDFGELSIPCSIPKNNNIIYDKDRDVVISQPKDIKIIYPVYPNEVFIATPYDPIVGSFGLDSSICIIMRDPYTNKTISLCYNLIKDSYYLKEDKTFVSVPKDKIDSSKEELLLIWEANKDKTKKKFVKK